MDLVHLVSEIGGVGRGEAFGWDLFPAVEFGDGGGGGGCGVRGDGGGGVRGEFGEGAEGDADAEGEYHGGGDGGEEDADVDGVAFGTGGVRWGGHGVICLCVSVSDENILVFGNSSLSIL